MSHLHVIQEFPSYVPCRINESYHVLVKGSIDGVNDSEFSEGLHHGEQHGSDDNKAKELTQKTVNACQSLKGWNTTYQASRSTSCQSLTGADEQTSTDTATCVSRQKNKLHLS